MDKKNKQMIWRCRFADTNPLALKVIFVDAPTLGDALIKLHVDLKPAFIASYLVEVSSLFREL